MKDVVTIINKIKELWERQFIDAESKADFHCKVFEGNIRAFEMTRAPEIQD